MAAIITALILALTLYEVNAKNLAPRRDGGKLQNHALKFLSHQGHSSTTTTKKPTQPIHAIDCQDIWNNGFREPGVFTIYPNGTNRGIQVWCEHSLYATATVFQRRQFGNVSFVQPWAIYKSGFGDPRRDYWLGLDTLYLLTSRGSYKLSIALQDWHGTLEYMVYDTFFIGPEYLGYPLTIGPARGYIIDDMAFSNGMRFATYDNPDAHHCATNQHAGWWYNYCAYALLNGKYYPGGPYQPVGGFYDGIYWKDWRDYNYSLKFVSMALVN